MKKNRLEALSDGVFAVIITIMVLEFRIPKGNSLQDLKPLLPTFVAYLLSFTNGGLYWNNHHHLIYAIKSINGATLWANLFLLFWLSFMPFATAWLGDNLLVQGPVMFYGFMLLMNAIGYTLLVHVLLRIKQNDTEVVKALKKNVKANVSTVLYLIGILASMYMPWISLLLYFTVACIWFVPDSRIEKKIKQQHEPN